MWFKNVRAYRLTSPFNLNPEQLQEKMQTGGFQPCGKSQPMSLGWVPPLGAASEMLVHAAAGRYLICMRREEKLLPASVVREQLAEKVEAIEHEEARKVYRKERLNLKDEIVQDCLPRAFTRSNLIFAYIDSRANWLFIDTSSSARAEELINLLREATGTLALLLPRVNQSPAAAMTAWVLHNNLPKDFALLQDCDMKDPGEDGGAVRCRGIELAGEEVEIHLQAGMQVVRLAVEWDEKVKLVLGEDLCLRRLRFADELVAENEDLPEADMAARLDADFALMTEVVSSLQDRIIELFGGEATE